MSSFFRVPGDDTSSEEDSNDDIDDDIHDPQELPSDHTDGLSRIQTMSTSAGVEEGRELPLPLLPAQAGGFSHQKKDLLIHSLLEERCYREAADELSKPQHDPDVIVLGQQKYKMASKGLHDYADVSPEFDNEAHRSQRDTVRQGLQVLSAGQRAQSEPSALPNNHHPGAGSTKALATTFRNVLTFPGGSGSGYSPEHRSLFAGVPESLQPLLKSHSGFNASRYVQDFEQKCLLGKGGYGHVYMAKNRVDGFDYAVKRIPLSSARVRKIQEGGQKELEVLLEEVRTLARLDHRNIVRYHNAWLEISQGSATSSADQSLRLLQAGPGAPESSKSSLHGRGSCQASLDSSIDVGFEDDDISRSVAPGSESRDTLPSDIFSRPSTTRKRRQSQCTVATTASSRSKKGTVESIGLHDDSEDDEDVETIPRDSGASFDSSTSNLANNMHSHSNNPSSSQLSRSFGFILTLNIQMSLHPITLEHFLAIDPPAESASPALPSHLKHCFHIPISLLILLKILKGVTYLHSQGIVHRDLKPANILLSVSTNRTQLSGSVDISSCQKCIYGNKSQAPIYINPRIGDFGLVGTLEDPEVINPAPSPRAVGTEFYRPTYPGPMSPKMDVFALGVILFELLREFSTRMERIMTLQNLKLGRIPEDFVKQAEPCKRMVEALIRGMTENEEERRLSCLEVKRWIEEILENA